MLAHENNFGLLGIEIYVPKKYVDQSELEQFDQVSQGKYTIGLGQLKMAVCDDREDINSICLTAVNSLLQKYQIDPKSVGRLEVGTETIIDKSKSVKSVLMQLFADSGNTDIEGIDTTNACYGGTNALFNCLNWLESPYWDGRYAIAVAADIAVYKSGSARPTGGAGAVAMLLGPQAPLVFDRGLRATHIEHVYDFYKPDLHSEYPEVDGPLSNKCYTKAADVCFNRYLDKLAAKSGSQTSFDDIDYVLFHCPYSKLVQKTFGRLAYNDFKRQPDNEKYKDVQQFLQTSEEESYVSRDLEKAFINVTKDTFAKKTLPTLLAAKNMGNMYCGSLYGGLCSLLAAIDAPELLNKRVLLFSYGSGLAASMFSLTVKGDTSRLQKQLDLVSRLDQRTKIEPGAYDTVMNLREKTHNARDYAPAGLVNEETFFKNTFYLEGVDSKFRRQYSIFQ
ncbi:hydroxymethylglutaryl-coenzyme A synthase C terminal-domain-containing protein [Gorgonomyces haynaldii]|nr:hydroxymethylglutaryl-coenzyme A synthase C terminal-domain-containing protein [Gorgonomyces haynaldii]